MKILWNILNFHRLLNKLIWFYFFSHKKDYTIKTLSCLLRGHSPQTQTDVEGQSCIGNVEQQTNVGDYLTFVEQIKWLMISYENWV